jgi:class 3 adenylate cyclase
LKRLRLPSLVRTDYTRSERLWALGACLLVGLLFFVPYAYDRNSLRLSLDQDENRRALLMPFDQSLQFQLFKTDLERRVTEDLARVRDKLVVVAIDEFSLEALDWTWPINRAHYQEIVAALVESGATTVGLDILFFNRSDFPESDKILKEVLTQKQVVVPYVIDLGSTKVEMLHDSLMTGTIEEYLQRTGFTQEWSDYDGIMRRALLSVTIEGTTYYAWDIEIAARIQGKTPAEVLAGLSREQETMELTRSVDGRPEKVKAQITYGRIQFASYARKDQSLSSQEQLEELMPGFYRTQANESDSNFTLDKVLLYIPLVYALSSDTHAGGLRGIQGGLIGPEMGPDGKPILDSAGQPRKRPFAAIVGVTTTAGYDLKRTPAGPMSGLEIHAYTIAGILNNSFRREPSVGWVLAFILACSLLAGFLISTFSFRHASLLLAAAFGMTFLLNRALYINSIDWPLILPLGAMATSFMAVNIAHVVTRNRRIAQRDEVIRNVQGILKELTPVDYDDLLATNGLVLGGKATELTVLFSDLRGYTSMAEKLTSVEVIDRLNDYFALLGPLLERFGGAVFDYQGDALMAVFGLKPNSQPNHAAAGCKAAAAIIYELEKQRKEWLRQGRPMPETGIGICTGMVAFGGLGTAQHKQYVAIGDPTNTASRMQGKSKELDSPVLITESTFEMAKSDPDVVMEYLEEIELKGKREPLKVYGVLVDPTASKLNLVSQVAPGAAPLHEQSPLL